MNALADIGLPMIAVYWPPAWLALIPIIAVEGWIARRTLRLSWRKTLISVGAANVASTLIGIPLVWFCLAFFELRYFGGGHSLTTPSEQFYAATVQGPWLLPSESDFKWMVPAAAMFLTLVFLVVSVGVESLVVRKLCRELAPKA